MFETGLQTSLGYRNRPRLKLALRMPLGTEDCRGGGGTTDAGRELPKLPLNTRERPDLLGSPRPSKDTPDTPVAGLTWPLKVTREQAMRCLWQDYA